MNGCREAAIEYARRGWKVIPIKEGTKRPLLGDWVQAATNSIDQIERWWQRDPDSGVGIVPDSSYFVLDVDVSNDKRGNETLDDLEAEHGELPGTVEVITGSGGRHLYFRNPRTEPVSNSAGRLGLGLDIRGVGGQVIAPPTLHPETLEPYLWEHEGHPDDIPMATAPDWLLDLLTPPPGLSESERINPDDAIESPLAWDRYNFSTSNSEVMGMLAHAGWELVYQDRDGVLYVRRPGKATGTSGTVGKVREGVFYCFTDGAEGFNAEHAYDPAYILAQTLYAGDLAEADASLVELGWGFASHSITSEQVTELLAEWEAEEISEILQRDSYELSSLWDANIVRPTPTVLSRSDGHAAIYPEAVHTIVGEPETGKSWIACYLSAQEMAKGNKVIYIDFESTVENLVLRLKHINVAKHHARGSYYFTPEHLDAPFMRTLMNIVEEVEPTVIVIDSVNRAMGAMGLSYESGPSYVEFTKNVVVPLRKTGASIVLIDHVVKRKEDRGRYATGSEQKLSQVDVSLHLEVLIPFAPNRDGLVGIRIAKDRLGGVKEQGFGAGEKMRWGLLTIGADWALEPWIDPIEAIETEKSFRARYPSQLMKSISDLVVDLRAVSDGELGWMIEAPTRQFNWAMWLLQTKGILAQNDDGHWYLFARYGYNPIYDKMAPEYDPDAPTPEGN